MIDAETGRCEHGTPSHVYCSSCAKLKYPRRTFEFTVIWQLDRFLLHYAQDGVVMTTRCDKFDQLENEAYHLMYVAFNGEYRHAPEARFKMVYEVGYSEDER